MMKFMGQNEKGQLLLEGESESILITKDIPAESPVVLFNFHIKTVDKLPCEKEVEIQEWARTISK